MADKDTGAIMAAIRCREMEKSQPLYEDKFATLFADNESFRKLDEMKATIPYFEDMLSVRHKLFIEQSQTILARDHSIQQIISFGAGYCSLVHDLIVDTNLRGFEIDRELVCEKKRNAILDYSPAIISLELTSHFQVNELIPFGFDITKKTLILMEGIIYYFKTIEDITAFFKKQSKFIFETKSSLIFDMQVGENPLSSIQREKTSESGMNDCFFPLSFWVNLFVRMGLSVSYFSKIAAADRWNRLKEFKKTRSALFLINQEIKDN